ncbi:TPA: hypothetical protein DCZ50_03125 [Candidatus Nomurabacteria bacterium]|uniref:Uncharacterized protein n=1 Tax=Candidatus Giovannonibacteria bacterium GW2011_GWF2_42_19 TaxID=1618659 RepID=A0A0G0ZB18_9BACT|nr:MAG: hypothetical protein UV11_C0039G0023 [Candidatus Giovannonibacteria bacterium GW2011_GWF2_42_19]HBB49850.1 hypothetical protein [Candidatus Nomurabacteria bacterium]
MLERVHSNDPEKFGKYHEVFSFGKIKTENPQYIRESEKCGGLDAYRKWGCAIELVKKYQPFDPTNPQKPFLKDLKLEMAEVLGLESDEDMDRIKIYTAVNSILDIDFGIDGFIEFEDKDGKIRMLTLDVTRNKAKIEDDAFRADMPIDDIPDIITEKTEYFEYLRVWAEKAAKIIQTKKPEENYYD